MREVLNYIKEKWRETIRDPGDALPYPYTSPSIDGIVRFYYWDNYFIHKGLLLDGYGEQVENNLDNFVFLLNKYGYIPNADFLTDRSQPPFFTRCVYEYYLFVGDAEIIRKYLPAMLKEYDFWMTERILPCGLNSYGCSASDEQLLFAYDELCDRVNEYRDTVAEKKALAGDILAVAESGLDFNMRFRTERSKLDAASFIHVDLNCILYDVERLISEMCRIIKDGAMSVRFADAAERRRKLINEFLYDKETGSYLDYDFRDKRFSETVTAVSFYPYTFGVSDDQEGCKILLGRLELDRGLSVGEYRGDDIYYQWDYPCMWPAATYLAYIGLKKVGLADAAARIAEKYISAVDDNFIKTGILWEKYDAVTGGVGYSGEYETPEMLGWTAGVYRFFAEELSGSRSDVKKV